MIVRGKDCLFALFDPVTEEMKPICCARTATLTTTADLAETSTVNTGRWKTFIGMKTSFTLSASGLVSMDMNISLKTLRRVQSGFGSTTFFTFTATDAGGRTETYSGNVIITSIDSPFSYNGNFEYSLQGQGTGELTIA